MTKEDKELLLVDLCARLPYRVEVCNVTKGREDIKGMLLSISRYAPYSVYILTDYASGNQEFSPVEDVRLYLRPMSSMTEEEKTAIAKIATYVSIIEITDKMLEFCCSHHLDFHNLIEKGLALEAPKGMYKIN